MNGRCGFTLIELLAVTAIIAIAASMSLASLGSFDKEAAVQGAASQLVAKLREVRGMAIQNQAPYALVFNIQNAPDSNGAVLNNRSGGHWYRVLGPSQHGFSANGGSQVLVPVPKCGAISPNGSRLWTFPEFTDALGKCWIGEAQSLPAGKVRILALADTDEGARCGGGVFDGGYYRARGYAYTSTYPRPWFGYFDPARKRLFSWGGYDPDLHASEVWAKPDGTDPISQYTGFFYQGKDGPVTGCRNQVDRAYDVDWNHDGDFADTDPVRGSEQGVKVWTAGEPRPLVNAAWLDFSIIFMPDGTAQASPFKAGRKRFKAAQAPAVPTTNEERFRNGIEDTTRSWYGNTVDPGAWGKTFGYAASEWYNLTGEVSHFSYHTGGYHITLAPDVRSDANTFSSVKEAMATMAPMWRVFIGSGGDITAFRVSTKTDSMLDGLNVFPSTPAVWQGVSAADSKLLGTRVRFGWLHDGVKDRSGGVMHYYQLEPDLIPVGRTFTDQVCPRMVTDKIWWIDG